MHVPGLQEPPSGKVLRCPWNSSWEEQAASSATPRRPPAPPKTSPRGNATTNAPANLLLLALLRLGGLGSGSGAALAPDNLGIADVKRQHLGERSHTAVQLKISRPVFLTNRPKIDPGKPLDRRGLPRTSICTEKQPRGADSKTIIAAPKNSGLKAVWLGDSSRNLLARRLRG